MRQNIFISKSHHFQRSLHADLRTKVPVRVSGQMYGTACSLVYNEAYAKQTLMSL
jgi:hypothetical protein